MENRKIHNQNWDKDKTLIKVLRYTYLSPNHHHCTEEEIPTQKFKNYTVNINYSHFNVLLSLFFQILGNVIRGIVQFKELSVRSSIWKKLKHVSMLVVSNVFVWGWFVCLSGFLISCLLQMGPDPNGTASAPSWIICIRLQISIWMSELEQGAMELVLRYDSLILWTWNCHEFDRYKLTNFCLVLK